MHRSEKCHLSLLLLSGTGEGPVLAKAFLEIGWKVSISVVSYQASLAYLGLDLENMFIGELNGVEGICSLLNRSRQEGKGFDYVIDATHPFATKITCNLKIACDELEQKLLRYERSISENNDANLINSVKELKSFDLIGRKLLLAIGSRILPEAFSCAQASGAIVFARVLPSTDGLLKALSSGIPQENLAVLRPSLDSSAGGIERALCRKWGITGVVCRQSGGYIEEQWQSISKKDKIDLWLISRPPSPSGIEIVYSIRDLIQKIYLRYS